MAYLNFGSKKPRKCINQTQNVSYKYKDKSLVLIVYSIENWTVSFWLVNYKSNLAFYLKFIQLLKQFLENYSNFLKKKTIFSPFLWPFFVWSSSIVNAAGRFECECDVVAVNCLWILDNRVNLLRYRAVAYGRMTKDVLQCDAMELHWSMCETAIKCSIRLYLHLVEKS